MEIISYKRVNRCYRLTFILPLKRGEGEAQANFCERTTMHKNDHVLSKASCSALLIACLMIPVSVWSSGPPRNLEPCVYKEDFETNELNAWASYPLWQDTAYDPNLRPGRVVPGDPNISLLLRVTPYSNVDNYAGAQKKLDMRLGSSSTISLRFYLKTELKPEFFKVRVACGNEGAIDFTVPAPPVNRWERLKITYSDLAAQNPGIGGRTLEITGLAVLAKFPHADPAMPIYLGLDDIAVEGARTPDFRFAHPRMVKLAEWKPYIPERHFLRGDPLEVKGAWPVEADRVVLRLTDYVSRTKTLCQSRLKQAAGEWRLPPVKLEWPEGLYLAGLEAFAGKEKIASTEFTILIAPLDLAGRHPRLWFDGTALQAAKKRLGTDEFKTVADRLAKASAEAREKLPLEAVVFDLDAFSKDEPTLGNVPRSIYPWFDRIRPWRAGVHENSLAYALLDDQAAGRYAKDLIVRLCRFPYWLHPWFESRGQHIYYPVGELGMDIALAYDLVFDLLSEEERQIVREGLWRNVIAGCHRSYVEDNLVTSNTSNWVAHVTAGSLLSQAAFYGESSFPAEPYFTGVLLKLHELIKKSIGRDGGYGESYGYCNFTMESLSKALPALANVFHVDFSGPLPLTYQDVAWATLYDKKFFLYFGDSSGNLGPMTNWAWLLARKQDPLLGWMYHFFKKGDTLADIIYETGKAPRREPFGENPVRAFRDIGTTVFRGGWKKDDFLFVLRTGAFYNHQHLDQGTFWLADRGEIFIEERHGSTYYDDPYYQSHYTQPVAHSAILVNRNPQSQRVGDPLLFIEGFNDHAFIHHFLDGSEAAFVCGDIGKLYWGKVKEMRRNALYLKPRTVLMLDTIVPAESDADITLLYQAGALKDIQSGPQVSLIRKGKRTLRISHLWPEGLEATAEETPLYINTLKTANPLTAEGMLALTARTAGRPLVLANLLTAESGKDGQVNYEKGNGCVSGRAQGRCFLFSTQPGQVYEHGGWSTDALALAWSGEKIFAALCTSLARDGQTVLRSDRPMTCEIAGKSLKYCLAEPSDVWIRLAVRPRSVLLNGRKIEKTSWDPKTGELSLVLPAGEGILSYNP
jgi:hypothetical protein